MVKIFCPTCQRGIDFRPEINVDTTGPTFSRTELGKGKFVYEATCPRCNRRLVSIKSF